MKYLQALTASFAVFLFVSAASAQKAEVSISLNEPFFDALLDSVFHNFEPPEFSMARNEIFADGPEKAFAGGPAVSWLMTSAFRGETNEQCAESVKILPEMRGVKTSVRFREGKIYVPLAFSGNYAPPLVGCVEFAGWAESNIDLEFDPNTQKLVGRIRVLNVNLNGTGGIGGSMIARLIQGSIDKKMNPVEILSLDKVSFAVPVQRSGTLKMRAVSIKPEVGAGALNVRVAYDFVKG